MSEPNTILLGVTASVSLYKACDLTRELVKKGYRVKVMMSRTAADWISPVLFSALSGEKVYTEADNQASGMPHIEVREGVDLFLIAPATAHLIARAAAGLAGDLLTQTLLSYQGPRWIAPAMNPYMYSHPATQNNLKMLREYGYRVLPVKKGEAVCGDEGDGKLLDVVDIVAEIDKYF